MELLFGRPAQEAADQFTIAERFVGLFIAISLIIGCFFWRRERERDGISWSGPKLENGEFRKNQKSNPDNGSTGADRSNLDSSNSKRQPEKVKKSRFRRDKLFERGRKVISICKMARR